MTPMASSPTYESILDQDRTASARALIRLVAIAVPVVGALYMTGLFDMARLATGVPAIVQLFVEMMPPDFGDAARWVHPLLDTLALSIAGTFLAVLLALPLALLAAANTTPHPALYLLTRTLLNFLRSVPELISGIIFVAAVGFGALPGVLALGLHSAGMVGKFFAEAIEHVDPKPVEAARAAGARPSQVIWHAVFPQVLPQMADITIYRWEYHFRSSTVIGMVGAGGIGLELMGSLRLMEYRQVSAILICILVMVTLVDAVGAVVRRRLK
jgi:phosphonate transport system permease protein